jgi:hypothetical protein
LDILDTITATQVVAANLYTKAQTDALVAASTPTIADASLTIAKTNGLQQRLDDDRDIRIAIQGQLGGTAAALVSSQQDLADLTSVVDSKASAADLVNGLLTRSTVSSLVAGLATKQDKLDSFSNLSISGISATTAAVGTLTSGLASIIVTSSGSNPITTAEVGSSASFCRFTHGHHIDSFSRNNNTGRTLYLNYYANLGVRFGNTNGKIRIKCDPSNYQLDCVGAARFSSSVSANNYITTSDQRIKENVQNVSLDECLRLIKTVHPKTYNRIDMDGAPRIGYIAQDFDRELKDNYRCIMGSSEDVNGPLLALDYSRIVPVLHGALLNVIDKLNTALDRIEALESKQ